ncbi:MAG: fibrobacter succinogenes major paralogous domain-containing protein, partial [Bacteroidales bacterium]|nr:fibrobacter succinogenes major paralogous domain-containing protein [Bacteroidales bacterium]
CIDEITKVITIDTLPIPTITGPNAQCFKQNSIFYTEKGMSGYTWTVTNGTIQGLSNLDSVIVKWDDQFAPNTGTVTVTYSNTKGCAAATPTVKSGITIYPLPATPVISGDMEVCFDSEITYSFVNQPAFNIVNYIWTVNVGDSIDGGTGYNFFEVNWTAKGNQTVTLRIIDEHGCTPDNTGTLAVEVEGEVKADFSFNTVCFNTPTSFTNTSTIGGDSSDDTNTLKWNWYLNEETTPFSSDKHTSLTLAFGDSIRLEVISNFNCIDEITKVIAIDTLPVPTITGKEAECFDQCTIYYTEKDRTDYVWTVTNGTIKDDISNRDSLEVCWNDAYGAVTGKVTVNYADGNHCRAAVPTEKDNITIYELPDNLIIEGSIEVCYNSEITYKFQPISGFNIAKYIWSVENGVVIAGGNAANGGEGCDSVVVKWTTPGVQKIVVAIVDDNDCEPYDSGELFVTVEGEVLANFSYDVVCLNTPTPFINLSTVGVNASNETNTLHWYWYQNLSTTPFSTDKNPEFTLNWGDSVRLEVISNFGCIHEITKTITLDTLPIPNISGSSAECFDDCTVYHTEKNMTNYIWTVTNGTIAGNATLDSVKICWDDIFGDNVGTVSVSYTDGNGCTAANPTEMPNITVYELPATPQIAGREKPCFDSEETYTFVPQPGFNITEFTWSVTGGIIKDGGTGYDYVKVHWNNFGIVSFNITLAIVDEFGCEPYEIGILPIKVEGDYPKISGEKMACLGVPEKYSTMSGMINYNWSVEGGIIVEGVGTYQPKIEWKTPGIGKLTVRYTNPANGCTYYMINKYDVDVRPCKIADCKSVNNKIVTEDTVGSGYYTHLNHDWNLKPISPFKFDSVKYYVNDILYDEGTNPTLYGSKYPVRKISTVVCVGYYYGIPDTCEFTVYVVMACPKSVDDIEDNTYTVTPLAGLCWTSNIMSTLYSSGISIPAPRAYQCPTCPDPSYTSSIFGLLYTWYDAIGEEETFEEFVQGICPEGYHIPSPEEFDLLLQYQPKDLKSEDHWLAPGTNNTKFNSLPAGKFNGTTNRFEDMYGFTGYWSTLGEGGSDFALYYYINYFCDQLLNGNAKKIDALSVRCIMDY